MPADSERAELQDDKAAMLARDVAGLGAKAWDALPRSQPLAFFSSVRFWLDIQGTIGRCKIRRGKLHMQSLNFSQFFHF